MSEPKGARPEHDADCVACNLEPGPHFVPADLKRCDACGGRLRYGSRHLVGGRILCRFHADEASRLSQGDVLASVHNASGVTFEELLDFVSDAYRRKDLSQLPTHLTSVSDDAGRVIRLDVVLNGESA